MSTVRLLSAEDIYDVYGLEYVIKVKPSSGFSLDDDNMISFRLNEIKAAYVHACKSRIRAEAGYLGIAAGGDFSFSGLLDQIKNSLPNLMEKEAEKMMYGGHIDVMSHIINAHRAAGGDLKGIDTSRFNVTKDQVKPPSVDPSWFVAGSSSNTKYGRIYENPRWHEIAKAYLAVEAAQTNDQIISSIDRLNQLQHNSFHVLIDLQTGRMLKNFTNESDDREARKVLQEILDVKMKSDTIDKFKDRMSHEVRKLIAAHRK